MNPTQEDFVSLVKHWYTEWEKEGWGGRPRPLAAREQLLALLLGTAGTGKTTCLKEAIGWLKGQGFEGVVVAAPTGGAVDPENV